MSQGQVTRFKKACGIAVMQAVWILGMVWLIVGRNLGWLDIVFAVCWGIIILAIRLSPVLDALQFKVRSRFVTRCAFVLGVSTLLVTIPFAYIHFRHPSEPLPVIDILVFGVGMTFWLVIAPWFSKQNTSSSNVTSNLDVKE